MHLVQSQANRQHFREHIAPITSTSYADKKKLFSIQVLVRVINKQQEGKYKGETIFLSVIISKDSSYEDIILHQPLPKCRWPRGERQQKRGLALHPISDKLFILLDLCVSSLRRCHAYLLCIVPSLTDDPRRESTSDKKEKKKE